VSSPVQGVRLVTLAPAPETTPSVAVRVTAIGGSSASTDGDPTYVVATSEGIAVLDKGQATVKVFDATGSLAASIGRFGAGPGELSREGIHQMLVLGEQLFVPDVKHRRMNRIDVSRLRWEGSVGWKGEGEIPLWWASLGPEGLARLSILLSSDGSPTLAIHAWNAGVIRNVMTVPRPSVGMAPTWRGSVPILASGPRPGTFILASPTEGTVVVYDREGRSIARYGLSETMAPKIAAGDQAFLRDLLAPEAEVRRARRIERLVSKAPVSARGTVGTMAKALGSGAVVGERYPYFTDVRIDATSGLLWIARPLRAGEIKRSHRTHNWDTWRRMAIVWDAYHPDGRFARRVVLPVGIIVTDLRAGRFYGIQVDASEERRAVVLLVGN